MYPLQGEIARGMLDKIQARYYIKAEMFAKYVYYRIFSVNSNCFQNTGPI